MAKRSPQKPKPCDRCQILSSIRYRVQDSPDSDWVLVCPACWQVCSKSPHYRYGGTWKAR